MSATAFQRMRREAAAKVAKDKAVKSEDKQLSNMTVEELKEYAEENNIDIGKSISQSGILEKIKKAQAE